MNVNATGAPVRQSRKRKTQGPLNFTNWSHKPWGSTWVVRNNQGQTVSNQATKRAYFNAKDLVPGERRRKTNNGAGVRNNNSGVLKTLGFNNKKKANAAYEKIKKAVSIIPGIGNTPETRVLRSALRSSLEHFGSSAVRQAHSGSILETTSFAVGALEAGVNVLYYEDAPIRNNILNITSQPRTFILKSDFSLNDTIKSNRETDMQLRQVWKIIVGLASTKSSVNENPNNMRSWVESKTSVYKGFKSVEPDVLEWVPDAPGCPNGLINIYELKIGEGKGESEPAEAYQLVKAKRAIELMFIAGGKEPPCFRLYFLPWMYATPANKKVKFTNYKEYPGHGVTVWRVLSTKDAQGYNIKELSRESFQALTGLSAEVITLTLDMLRNEEANLLLKILQHIKRHSLGYGTTSRQTYIRTQAALRRAKKAGKVPRQNAKQFAKMQTAIGRLVPGKNIPKGTDNLAHYIRTRPQGIVNAKASDIVMRAYKRLASRPESKYAVSVNGQVLKPSNFGFSRNNNYVSNAEGPGIRNNKEMQRIRAGLDRLDVLNWNTRRIIQSVKFNEKLAKITNEGQTRANAEALLNRANLNSTRNTQFEVLYRKFLNTHAGPAGQIMTNLLTLKRNSAANNNTRSYYNGLATRLRSVS
jgi:hypothetical protein